MNRTAANFHGDRGGSGFVLIEMLLVVLIILVIAAVAIPNLVRARRGANEATAISSLRTLVTTQQLYRDGDLDGDTQDDYAGSLVELADELLIDPLLGAGAKAGYLFVLSSSVIPEPRWEATAVPADDDAGTRCFVVDETGEIRVGPPCPATADNPTLEEVEAERPVESKPTVVDKFVGKFLRRSLLRAILVRLDLNSDGNLTFDEVLSVDSLGVSRSLLLEFFPNGPGGGEIASDTYLDGITQEYLDALEADLQLGIANENEGALPRPGGVPLGELVRAKAVMGSR